MELSPAAGAQTVPIDFPAANAIDRLNTACRRRYFSWALELDPRGIYLAVVYDPWPLRVAEGVGRDPYAAAAAALDELERRSP